MLSVCSLFILFVLCLLLARLTQKSYLRYAALGAFNLLVMECSAYLYFLFLIYHGTCFF